MKVTVAEIQNLNHNQLIRFIEEGIMPEPDQLNHEQPKITGYRTLSPEEVALINSIKSLANQVGDLIHDLSMSNSIDLRWLNIAKTDLQKGFMFLNRAVAQPTGF